MTDATVVIAVYNTMPYLRDCLASVFDQSIGLGRLEVIAVDDGSTDGSGDELDRWQQRHPDIMRVIHQENSGGPAAPSNRALELATGRYVFFLGADDRLGREALERLVRTADELEADVVLGRLVGDGGRWVSQAIFDPGDRDDITLVNSALPMALSNTKLFRRSMLEEHRIRYPEGLVSGSDRPFTLQAIAHARRVSVRADYKFYYAMRRTDSSNITYGTPLHCLLNDAATVMDLSADLITDPAAHARLVHRHFDWELAKLVGPRFLEADRAEQTRVQDGIRKLAETYLTEPIRSRLEVHKRISLSVAQFGTLDDLIAVVRHHQEHKFEPVVVEGDRHYLAYPGFRTFPDEWFDASERLVPLPHQAGPAEVRWGRNAAGKRAIVVEWRSTLDLDHPDEPAPRAFAGDHVAVRTDISADGRIRADFAVDDLVAEERYSRRRQVRFTRTVGGEYQSLPVTWTTGARLTRVVHRQGARIWVVSAVAAGRHHQLRIVVHTITPRRLAGALARRLRLKK
ncbi:glycosyltransferase [Actinoplanes sp. NPDC051633]|uniref:glycosyltransferase family 2 protein n=1 Tax=Actinoplanes sp. NPDC051633 TaxID=3155670 RepID=UPI0034382E0A